MTNKNLSSASIGYMSTVTLNVCISDLTINHLHEEASLHLRVNWFVWSREKNPAGEVLVQFPGSLHKVIIKRL